MSMIDRFTRSSRELKLFIAASLIMGLAYSLVDSTFNNYLNERFALSGFQRSFLEFPRELPGFLVVFVSAGLVFLTSRRLGGVALMLGAVGALLIGFISDSYGVMIIWLFIYSLGQHLFMPVAATIGMELARDGQAGRRLGQLNAVRNAATIAGSFLVFIGFRYLGLTFQWTFAIAAAALAAAGVLLFRMPVRPDQQRAPFLKLRKEYRLYYILAVLYGSRKQLFITFAPWVLVTVFKQPTQTLATLLTIGGVIGILFQPLLGWAVDRLGERFVLMAEAILLVGVCLGYGFGRSIFPENIAFYLACVCFLLDQMLMSVNMARSTFMKKIARTDADVQPALSAAISLDHIFSITIALAGGAIWNFFGYQNVFLLGVGIALLNLVAAAYVRVPVREVQPELLVVEEAGT